MAFLDINPLAIGHTVVIPKEHCLNIIDLPQEKIRPVFGAVQKVAILLDRTFHLKKDKSGFTIGINHGKIGGQMVEHLHIHIIPRFEGDGGRSLSAVVNNPPKENLEEVKKKILQN